MKLPLEEGKRQGLSNGLSIALGIYNGDKQFYAPLIRQLLYKAIDHVIFFLSYQHKYLVKYRDRDVFNYSTDMATMLIEISYLLSLYQSRQWKIVSTAGKDDIVYRAELNTCRDGKRIYILSLQCPKEQGAAVDPMQLVVSTRIHEVIELYQLPPRDMIDVLTSIQYMLREDAKADYLRRKRMRRYKK